MPPKPKTRAPKKPVIPINKRSPKPNTTTSLGKKPMSKTRKIVIASALTLAALSAIAPSLLKMYIRKGVQNFRHTYRFRNSNPGKNNVNSVDPGGRRPITNIVGPGQFLGKPVPGLGIIPHYQQMNILKQILTPKEFSNIQKKAENIAWDHSYPKNAGAFIKRSRTPSRNLNNVLGNRMKGWNNM